MDTVNLSVSALCRAAVDPEWRARWIRGENPSSQVYPPPGSVTAYGTRFHGFAAHLVRTLLKNPSHPADVDSLLHCLLEAGGTELLDGLLENEVDAAAQLTNALHFFAERVAALRERAPGAAWSDIFVGPEFAVEDVRFEVVGGVAFVPGSIDCVRNHPTAGLEVVDYKLTRGADLPKEIVQLAIYRQLLRRTRGTAPVGTLEYFSPQLHVQELSAGDLDAAFEHWVVPALSEMIRARQGGPPRPARATPAPSTAPAAGVRIGATRALTPIPVDLELEQLKRHVAVLGGSGSGKTTLALSILEQLLRAGVPVLLIDRKGDLCRYGDAFLKSEQANAALHSLLATTDVAVFTPGQERGRSLSITLLPAGIEHLVPSERSDAYRDAAAALAAMLPLKATPADQAKQAILVQALRALGETRASATITLDSLIELIGSEDPALLEAMGHLDAKHCKKIAEQLQTMAIMRGELLAPSADALSAELLFGFGAHAKLNKTRLSIISTKFLGDEPATLFWVSQLLLELNRFASRSPSPTLQAAVMFDEADIYLPATSKPPTKGPLESLLKRARSAGLSVMLATQSPGDLDYKCRENIRNWFIGLVKETRALEKLKPLLSDAKLDATAVLPKQKVGQFFMLSEQGAVAISAERNLVETQQLSDGEIVDIARASG